MNSNDRYDDEVWKDRQRNKIEMHIVLPYVENRYHQIGDDGDRRQLKDQLRILS